MNSLRPDIIQLRAEQREQHQCWLLSHGARAWLRLDADRAKAEEMLISRDHGTFMIRWSAKQQKYVLPVKCGNEIGHCLINNGAHGFGFTEPFKYSSLTELVLHYAVNSLEGHNKGLRTTLMFPIGSDSSSLEL